jgi:hypothetical protein
MPLQDTNLIIQSAPIPATFRGNLNQFREAMVERFKIVSPSGISFIFVGDTEPTSNVGPWLRNGTQWWVFDEATKRYIPLDITASEKLWFQTSVTTPADTDPPVWLRVDSAGNPISWLRYNGTEWVTFNGIPLAGSTDQRPSAPVEFQQFYDTDISVLIWWERGAWRTVSGNIGDVKFVAWSTLTQALEQNPGWEVLGKDNQTLRGRYIVQAAKDSGATPETTLPTDTNVPVRAAFEVFGETQTVDVPGGAGDPVYPPTLGLWTLVKT